MVTKDPDCTCAYYEPGLVSYECDHCRKKRERLRSLPASVQATREELWQMPTMTIFHRLWTRAVDQPGYDKKEWQELERRCRDYCRSRGERE